MTITKKPVRPAAAAPRRKPAPKASAAEDFIEAATHAAPASSAADSLTKTAPALEVPAQEAPALEAPVVAAPEPAPIQPPAPEAEEEHAKAKGKKKDKGKDKDKRKKKGKKNKEAAIIRFEDEQLAQIDERAAALGLSRAAWVRMVVAQALKA